MESDAYLKAKLNRKMPKERFSMDYPFPNIKESCPICTNPGCARWKGYFIRLFLDSELGRSGMIAIHVGECRKRNTDFSMIPDFLIPGRRLSRQTQHDFMKEFQQFKIVGHCGDTLARAFSGDEGILSNSSLYNIFYQGAATLRMNHLELKITSNIISSVFTFREISEELICRLYKMPQLKWCPMQDYQVIQPP